jgi:hypothetical protein
MTASPRPTWTEGLEINPVSDGLVIYQASPEQVHHLNNTSAVIFSLCDGNMSIPEITTEVQSVFSLEEPPIGEVTACIAELTEKALLR